ncbi:MAG: sialate O-acetylesterase [Phycisphaeraceae bacterium]
MNRYMAWSICSLAALLLTAGSMRAEAPKPVRLFILSGQSNMAAMDPEISFVPAVTAAFPDDDVVVVKFARSGQLMRMWFKEWTAPEGAEVRGQGKSGKHYTTLMAAVAEAMKDKAKPVSVTFVWMQGEADANHKGYGEIYGAALDGLLAQLQNDLGRKDIDFVLGRISDFGNEQTEDRPGWNIIRETQVAFVQKDAARRAWVDTDDLNGAKNGLHYTRDGYKTLGERFAQQAIQLIRARK